MNAASKVETQDTVYLDTLDDSFRERLFVDVALPHGGRLLALADPVRPSAHALLAAAAAVSAFEEAFVATAMSGPAVALEAAFAAANRAVCTANQSTIGPRRSLVGLAAVAVEGGAALIGLAPPAQVLLLQDGRLSALPEAATWLPLYMPRNGDPNGEPLGLRERVQTIVRRTDVRPDDCLVVGTGALGRCLAASRCADWAGEGEVAERLAEVVEGAGVEGAYAACVRVGDFVAAASREHDDRVVSPPAAAERAAGEPVRQPERRAEARDQVHDWLIDRSERILGRRAGDELTARRRVPLPPGAGSIRRYTPARGFSLSPDLRCRLPRGPRIPASRRVVVALLTFLLMLGAGGFGYDVRQARATRQDRHLTMAKTALEAAAAAPSPADADRHLDTAQRSLDEALDYGAKRSVIQQWQGELTRTRDAIHGVHRLSAVTRIGMLPPIVSGDTARLIALDGRLYLIAGGVYQVDGASRHLTSLLAPGKRLGKTVAGRAIDATVDQRQLVVTDGKAVFRLGSNGTWSARALAAAPEKTGWEGTACGAFKGSFYVLADGGRQILKFRSQKLNKTPDAWLTEQAAAEMGRAVDMVVDGSIYVLRADGGIETFYRGKSDTVFAVDPAAKEFRPVAMTGGRGHRSVYVLGRDGEEGRLVRVDPSSGESTLFLAPSPGHPDYDWLGADALSRAEDIAVDEGNGLVYFVTAEGLWQASIE